MKSLYENTILNFFAINTTFFKKRINNNFFYIDSVFDRCVLG